MRGCFLPVRIERRWGGHSVIRQRLHVASSPWASQGRAKSPGRATRPVRSRTVTDLLRHDHPRATEFRREVLELGQPILHRQDGLRIIDMDFRAELQTGYGGRVDVDQSQGRVVGHDVAAACLAELSPAHARLLETSELFRSLRDHDIFRLP
jgi:hypothetical protein